MPKILFIEDEPTLQKELKEILEQEKFKIFSAFDGEEGLNIAKKEEPNLILLDLILPKKDGFEVLKELKEDPKLRSVPVIVLTNLEGVGDIEKTLELGATTYLVKANYKLEDIISKIKELLK